MEFGRGLGMKALNFFCRQNPLSLLGSKYCCTCFLRIKFLTTLVFPENIFNGVAVGISPPYFCLYHYFFFAVSCTRHSKYLTTSTE